MKRLKGRNMWASMQHHHKCMQCDIVRLWLELTSTISSRGPLFSLCCIFSSALLLVQYWAPLLAKILWYSTWPDLTWPDSWGGSRLLSHTAPLFHPTLSPSFSAPAKFSTGMTRPAGLTRPINLRSITSCMISNIPWLLWDHTYYGTTKL